MPIQVSRLPDEPIVLLTFEEDSQIRGAFPEILRQIIELRDAIAEPITRYYVLIDVTRYDFAFVDLVYTLGELKGIGALRRPDRPAHMILVGAGGIVEMAAKAFNQNQYGGYNSRVFATLDEALTTVRKAISERP